MDRHPSGCSKKPLLVAGHGIRIAKAQDELMRVLDLGIPVVATFNGFDLVPSDHRCFVGRIGTVGTYGGNNALRSCDLLICVGTRNNIRQVSYNWKSFAPQAAKVVVDIDQAELDKPTVNAVHIKQDAKKFLNDFANDGYQIDPAWLESLREYNSRIPENGTEPYRFMSDLTSLLPEGAVVVCGNGTACVAMFQSGIVKRGQRIFWNSGCAAMGYDLPAAIGAHFGTGKPVVCVTGDGSIQMNIQELQTIKHHNLPIKIFVLNNGGYRSLEITQENYFSGDYIGCNEESGVTFPNLLKLAKAYDLNYYVIGEDRISDVLNSCGPTICEVILGKGYIFSPKFTDTL